MKSKLRFTLTTVAAFSMGAFAVVAASCLQLRMSPRADAQTDAAQPQDQRVAAADRSAADLAPPPPGGAAVTPFIGQIVLFAGTFVPRGWAPCDGRELVVADNTELFSVIGATYGGDGRNTFRLPDLRGRVPVGEGQGAALSPRTLGERGGAEQVTITVNALPPHTHPLMGSTLAGTLATPNNALVAAHEGAFSNLTTRAGSVVAMNGGAIGETGGGQPLATMPPHLTLQYLIAIEGVYPQRS